MLNWKEKQDSQLDFINLAAWGLQQLLQGIFKLNINFNYILKNVGVSKTVSYLNPVTYIDGS